MKLCPHRCLHAVLTALLVWIYATSSCPLRAQEKDDSVDKDYSSELPKIAPKTPEQSRRAIKLIDGFRADLVASEPLIRSPMAMAFDEFARAYVVELPEYNQYAITAKPIRGAIKRLEDTDRDGRYDKATTYVDNLDYPTAVACWKGGILIGVAPDLIFCRDTDGDGKADIRKRLFTGFGQDKAGEGMLNSFRWRIDNMFHIPTGLDGGKIVRVGDDSFEPINARGQHLLLDPQSMNMIATSGGGQHGMTLDQWNLHGFVCGNSQPIHTIMYDGRYIIRNKFLEAPAAAVNIAPSGKYTKLMRISAVEPWRILRTRLRKKKLIPGSDEGGTPSGFFTGATGITAYGGDAWPEHYRGQLFVGEVANNLVYRARLERNGVNLSAHRADTKQEFLASSDNWFRPAQFANAPDGTLYVIDMYRELIEGAAFLAPPILKHMDPAAGFDKGRVYRIAPDSFTYKVPPRLGDLSSLDLVEYLEHPNQWHRETASRLIYERQEVTIVPRLRQMASQSESPLARVVAMYSLQGLKSLDSSLVLKTLSDTAPEVRIHALILSEQYPKDIALRDAVLGLQSETNEAVRYQLAFSLGAHDGPQIVQALARLAQRDGANSWFRIAILSSAGNRRGEVFAAMVQSNPDQIPGHIVRLLESLAKQIGAAGSRNDIALLLKEIDVLSNQPRHGKLSKSLLKIVSTSYPAIQSILKESGSARIREALGSMLKEAETQSVDSAATVPVRVTAIRTLATAGLNDERRELFARLIDSRQPPAVQTAAIQTLAFFDQADVANLILKAWPAQSPSLRATSLETLFARDQWIESLLDAIKKKTLSAAELDPARIVLLKKHVNVRIRQEAMTLLASATLPRRMEIVNSYQKALSMKGDLERGRKAFKDVCAACHKLEGVGESVGADLKAIRDRGLEAVMLNILDPNREVKPQFLGYVIGLDNGRTVSGMITAENSNSLTIRKADRSNETVLRVNIDEMSSTGMSFMPEGLEKQIDHQLMADLLAYLNSIN